MLPRIASFALAAVCALLYVHPADGAIVRYETSTVAFDGSAFPDDIILCTVFDLPSREQNTAAGFSGGYINFEIDTATGEVSNYFIRIGFDAVGSGHVTEFAGT